MCLTKPASGSRICATLCNESGITRKIVHEGKAYWLFDDKILKGVVKIKKKNHVCFLYAMTSVPEKISDNDTLLKRCFEKLTFPLKREVML